MRAEIHPKKEGEKAIFALTSYLLGECGTKGGLTLAFLQNEKGAISDGGVGERLFFGFGMASLCMQMWMWASSSSTLRFPPFSSSSRERTQMREGGVGSQKGRKNKGEDALCVADREKGKFNYTDAIKSFRH